MWKSFILKFLLIAFPSYINAVQGIKDVLLYVLALWVLRMRMITIIAVLWTDVVNVSANNFLESSKLEF